MRARLFPSLLAADFATLGDAIREAEAGGADGFHLDVISSEVKIPQDNSCLPQWGEFDVLSEITQGKNADDCDEE